MIGAGRKPWLKDRQFGCGGTDMASVCGVGFHRAAEVYEEKVAAEPIDREPSALMLLGLATEQTNADLYAKKTGAKLIAPGLIRAKSEPWAFATFDRLRLDDAFLVPGETPNYGCPVELKYTPFFGDGWGPDGSDEVKDGYTIQATWEALILRLNGHPVTRTDVSALSGTGDHRVYAVPFDEQLGAMLLELGRAFWQRVEARAGVADWHHPLLADVEKRLAVIRPDTTVPLGEEAVAIVAAIDALAPAKKAGEEAEAEIKSLKKRLVELVAPAEVGLHPDGRTVKLYPIEPGIVTPRPYEREGRTDVRILKAKKGKVRDAE